MPENQTSCITEPNSESPFLNQFIADLNSDIETIKQSSAKISKTISQVQAKIDRSFSRIEPAVALKDHNLSDIVRDINQLKAQVEILKQQDSGNIERLEQIADAVASVKINSELEFKTGKYAGKRISDAPAGYLLYLFDNHYSHGAIDRYIAKNYHLIKHQALKYKR